MAAIVISYRRADTGWITGRVFDRLEAHFGRDSVFMDIDNIPLGRDFREHIKGTLDRCDVLLAIIGPNWLGGGDRDRLSDESDWVRIEIETALAKKVPVIPVLIDQAQMPKAADLPGSLRDLAFHQAAKVDTGIDFSQHMERLIRSLDDYTSGQGARPPMRGDSSDARPRPRPLEPRREVVKPPPEPRPDPKPASPSPIPWKAFGIAGGAVLFMIVLLAGIAALRNGGSSASTSADSSSSTTPGTTTGATPAAAPVPAPAPAPAAATPAATPDALAGLSSEVRQAVAAAEAAATKAREKSTQARTKQEAAREASGQARAAAAKAREAAQKAEQNAAGYRVLTGQGTSGQWRYAGQVRGTDTREGVGVITYGNGSRYEGEWMGDRLEGLGIYSFATGAGYEGELKNNDFNGVGVYFTATGKRYEGEFESDNFSGLGVYTFPNNERYEGEFGNEKYNGRGVYYIGSGTTEEQRAGDWVDDAGAGYVVITTRGGARRWEGAWKDDKKNGYGAWFESNGRVSEQGLYANGELK